MDIIYTQRSIITLNTNQFGFYGNIFLIFWQIFFSCSDVTKRLFNEYSPNFYGHGYEPLYYFPKDSVTMDFH